MIPSARQADLLEQTLPVRRREVTATATAACCTLDVARERRFYRWMRWGTVAGIVIATLVTSFAHASLSGIAALGALLGCYVVLVRYHYGSPPIRTVARDAPQHHRVWGTLSHLGDLWLQPVPYLMTSALLAFALMLVPSVLGEESVWFCVLFFVVVGEASRQLRDASTLKMLVACSIALVVLAFLVVVPPVQRLAQSLYLLPFYVGLVAAAAGGWHQQQQEEEHLARLALLDELQRSRAELERANHELQVYAGTVEELAVANERNRLARELHDILGYTLATVVVKAEAAKRLLNTDPERVAADLDCLQEIARSGLAEVRCSVSGLRDATRVPSVWHQVATRFVQQFGEQTHIAVTCAIEPLPPSHDPEVPVALFRIMQEALTNVSRHAHAAQVSVSLCTADDEAVLEIRDDGVGIPPNVATAGYGLRGMRERALLLGGSLVLSSTATHGTCLLARLPLHPPVPTSAFSADGAAFALGTQLARERR
jgi:signal transduction histidine kinase